MKYNQESILGLFAKEHGDKYDYSKVEYTAVNAPVTVTCSVHGDFSITPKEHFMGKGCPDCSAGTAGELPKVNNDIFIPIHQPNSHAVGAKRDTPPAQKKVRRVWNGVEYIYG